MKKLFAAVLAMLAFAGTALAATPTSEPSLPADIATWAKTGEVTCQYPGKTILLQEYSQESARSGRFIFVTHLNGQKVYQVEGLATQFGLSVVVYARNSAEGNWLKYSEFDPDLAFAHLMYETGLTKKQLENCTAG